MWVKFEVYNIFLFIVMNMNWICIEMFWIWNKDYGDVFIYVYIYMLYMYNFIEIVNVKWGFLK